MPEQPQQAGAALSFLAFDFGTRRTGVASVNTLLGRAQPLRTIAGEDVITHLGLDYYGDDLPLPKR